MAVAGSAVPTLRVQWHDGGLHPVGRTEYAQLAACFSQWGAGMGSLDEAVDALMLGRVVRIDNRTDSYLVTARKCAERVRG